MGGSKKPDIEPRLPPQGDEVARRFMRGERAEGPRTGTLRHPEAPGGTAGHPEAPVTPALGTPRYPEAPEGTTTHPEAPDPAPRAKGHITRKNGAVTRKMNVGFRPKTAAALEAICAKNGWRMNIFVDDAVRARLRGLGVDVGDEEGGNE